MRAAALGFFDGVHLGHAALLDKISAAQGLTPCVVTFDRQPSGAISGETVPLINSASDRAYILEKYFGITDIVELVFDEKLQKTDRSAFLDLLEMLEISHIVAGSDYRFGASGAGNAEYLFLEASQRKIGCEIVDEVTLDGENVRSTSIRAMIAEGETERAARFLGHPHILGGTVAHGRKIGRTIGLPTLNLPLPDGIQPPRFGVYATRTVISGETLPSVTNVGRNPTVGADGISVETHIPNWSGNAYGERVVLEFGKFLRPEQKFGGLDALKKQIEIDKAEALEYWREREG